MLLFPMIYYFCTHQDKHNDHEKQTIFYYSSHAALIKYSESGSNGRLVSYQVSITS